MMETWSLIDAQDHLEELVQRALEHRPQRVEVGPGSGAVVIVGMDDYTRLAEAVVSESRIGDSRVPGGADDRR